MSAQQTKLPYDETFQCVQCGYCLPACPTYQVLEKESASPRGRIALVKAAAEGKIDLLQHLAGPIDQCLGCRACEVACPSGVRYGMIFEGAKQTIQTAKRSRGRETPLVKALRRLVFEGLFPYPGRLKALGGLIWLYQKSGLRKVAHAIGITKKLPFHMGEFEAALPDVPSPFAYLARQRLVKAKGAGVTSGLSDETAKAKVAFFAGCVMDSVFYETNRKSIELLAAAGCDVVVPQTQTCCGALHAHAGELEQAKELAKRNIEAFEATGADWYVNNAGGCGAMLIEYDHLLADEPEWAERATQFVQKSRDINVILAQLGPLPFRKELPYRITYQDSCHLRNVQKVESEPRELLRSIPGTEYVELPGADGCCGSAGIYSLVQYETSMKVLDEKMKSVEATQATLVVTSNPGCLLQMRMGIQRANLQDWMQAVHIVDLLHEACGLG
ncbi:(Fe-S)-binding protein [Effusibacillus pohliae]|uniref:(Fe-S)-binding protein n=1 Tax=Effusibacillus pohliae TaxID=232270 RepID=UPI000370F3B8|nr:(Fe-S)-binding protein [Effusibacillus pohliae]